jgi:hypothetical protein
MYTSDVCTLCGYVVTTLPPNAHSGKAGAAGTDSYYRNNKLKRQGELERAGPQIYLQECC